MAEISGSIVEVAGAIVPADLANTIAIVGYFPDLDSSIPEIVRVGRFGDVKTLAGYGKGADLAGFALREANERGNPATVYCVPHPATIAGSITDDSTSGFGPGVTLAAINTHPFDDATVKMYCSKAGILGVAEFQLSTAHSVTRDVGGGTPTITPLYEAARIIPAQRSAHLTGDVDLTSIVYALPAIVTGNIDIVNSTTLYGSAGTLAGKEFDIDIDGGGAVTVAFGTGVDAPASYLDVLAEIAAVTNDSTPSVTNLGYLRLTGAALSTAGSIVLMLGTADALVVLGLTAATKANVRGNVDVTAFNYNAGAALDTLTFIVDEDTAAAQTVTFDNTITNSTLLLAALNGGTTNLTFSIDSSNFLLVESDTYGNGSTIALGAGTAHTALLGTPVTTSPGTGTTSGTAGALDGLTVIYNGDATSGSQTWTMPTAGSAYASAAALIAAGTARTGVDASLYSSANYMRIGSSTLGDASTFAITGGTALTALGLSVASATGAASEFEIDHLGVKLTFAAGTYSVGYTRTWTTKAPACTTTDLQNAITALVSQEVQFGRIVCASNVPLGQLAAFIQAAASSVGVLEGANDARYPHAHIMAPFNEADIDVKTAYISAVGTDVNVGRRVDLAARSAYVRPAVSSPNNTGSLLRSAGWSAVARYASLPLGSDVGQYKSGPLSYVDYAPAHEDAASVKMGGLRTAEVTPRALVFQRWGDGYRFDGGYTLAPRASAYADQHVRDGILRVAQLTHVALIQWLNDPRLPLDSTGKLTESGAGAVSTTVLALLSPLIAPQGASDEQKTTYLLDNVRVSINRTDPIGGPSGTQRIKCDVVAQFKGIARAITFTVGAGLITVA